MKTKIFSLLFVLVMALALLVSCGNKEKEKEDGPTDGPTGPGGDPVEPELKYDYTWKQTDIKVSLTNNSNSSELTSGCKRYYAGADTSAFQEIDNNIRARNQLAQKAANVKVSYTYIEDSATGKGWGGNINDMVTETQSGSQSAPDIYCNFSYDMTCAALRGCFSNLLRTDYDGGNHFRFIDDDYNTIVSEEDYFNSEAGEGYFYQYMESLSLTPDSKIYCLASNYTIDVVRSFLVIPVNVNLMNQISLSDAEAAGSGDFTGDGKHDIQDFYELVWANKWDYDLLAGYSQAIFQTGSGLNRPETDIGDSRIGFAIGVGSGLSSSGLLYTTSVKILNRNPDGTITYPTTNPQLNQFATNLKNLFEGYGSNGVCTVVAADAKQVEANAKTELDGIRIRFAANHVLFGGIICVGSLEDQVYQSMRSSSEGFGIVPVPLYRSNEESGDEYKTLVHNLARIMAISKATTKFAQCSAFLDYQSRTSAEILEDYYGYQLANATGGTAGKQNARMLTYIRNHVNDCFDKTYEDAIANYAKETDETATSTRFHGYLMSNHYKVASFSTVYDAVLYKKRDFMKQVYTAWQGLE